MKFVQIHTFYPDYLSHLYINNEKLQHLSFEQQINVLINDGFAASHMIAPHLKRLGYETHLIIANCPESQLRWLSEHKKILKDPQSWLHEIVLHQIEYYKPDVLYLSDPITFDSNFIRNLSWKPRMVIGWRAATIPAGIDWSAFDLMLSNVHGCLQEALRRGVKKIEYFMPGFPSFLADAVINEDKHWDVLFSGQLSESIHPERREFVKKVAESSSDSYFKYSFGLFSPDSNLPEFLWKMNQGARWGLEMYRILKRGRIVLNPICTEYFGSTDHINMRHLEASGIGSFLLTNEHENLKKYFIPGVEIETFCDQVELIEKIHYYLVHQEEREVIARRGQERCLRDYSMNKRADELDNIICCHLHADAVSQKKVTVEVKEMKIKAAELLAADDTSAAFDLLVQAKALKEPLEGLDLLRAYCFIQFNQPASAIEALREELRWFPGNLDALQILMDIQKRSPALHVESLGEAEFQQLLDKIRPYTMLSEQRLYSLYKLARHVCENNIPGNFVECGVAAGGSSALLAWVIKKYSNHPRSLFACDSFSGMPSPTASDCHQGVDAQSTGWGTGTCAAPETSVKEICSMLDVADVLTTVKGYFEETLPQLRDWMGMIALLHMDGDWYESTRAILGNLYDRLMDDALIQVDDYGYWDGCKKAIHEFEVAHSVKFSIAPIDGTGVWFAKPNRFPTNSAIKSNLIDEFTVDDPNSQGIESQMSANERFQLYWAIRNLLPAPRGLRRFIEIGSYSGASLFLAFKAFMRNNVPFQGIAVEPGGTPMFYKVLDAVKEHVIHLQMFSHEAALNLAYMFNSNTGVDFILVDGDHTHQGVCQDIENYYPFLTPGGIILFHDWLPPLDEENRPFIYHHHAGSEPGIRQACLELMEKTYRCEVMDIPLLYPEDPTQTQAHLPIIPGVYSTVRAYRKPL